MHYDWHVIQPPAFLDFETQSRAELTTTHQYVRDPSTTVLCCCVRIDGYTHRFGPYLDDDAKRKLRAIADRHTLVAHNAPFDAAVWEQVAKLGEAAWYDTLPNCRARGLPGKLDDVGKILTGRGKDPMGTKLIDLLCKIKKHVPAIGPAHKLIIDYCARDCELLEQIFAHVRGYGEPAVMDVDYAVNQRGIPVNRDYLTSLLVCYAENTRHAGEHFDDLTEGLVNPRSNKQMLELLQAQGFKLDGLNKNALAAFSASPDEFYIGEGEYAETLEFVREIIHTRRDVVRVGEGKASAAARCIEPDGRLREQLVYWGSHLGRWTGRALQPHNLPKPPNFDVKGILPEWEEVQRIAKERGVSPVDILNGMLRQMVQSESLAVADYGQIEARCLAWLAEEPTMLEIFGDPERSMYKDMGAKLFGSPPAKGTAEYDLSKALVLGCGYGMSPIKFEYTCKLQGVNTSALTARGIAVGDAVKEYRKAYPLIPQFWRKLGDAVLTVVATGASVQVGRLAFHMHGKDMHLVLPSGRPIIYRNARVEMEVPAYCAMYGMPPVPVPTVIFDGPRGRGFLYGAKIAENVCQGASRDVMAHSLVDCEGAGLLPVIHVHDEIGCETPQLELQLEIMSAPRPWTTGFPILVEGHVGPMWSKQPKGYRQLSAMNGKILLDTNA